MTQMSDYLEDEVIDHLLRAQSYTPAATVYLALFTTATTDAGGGTEATGGSYARQAITFSAGATGTTANTASLTFSNMPAGTFTHAAICDAVSAGNFLFHGALTSSKTTTLGQAITIGIGEIDVSFTAGSNATNYFRNLIIDRFLRNQAHTPAATIYMATYTDATDRTGGGTESTGGSYARQSFTYDAASAGVSQNSGVIDFVNMPTANITDAAVHNDPTAGNMMLFGTLNATLTGVTAGDTVRFAAAAHTLTVR